MGRCAARAAWTVHLEHRTLAMPLSTPFHERTSAACTSLHWKDWAGYHAVCRYEHSHEPEYHAVRHAAGLLDVSPLFKIDVTGRDAAAFLAWVTARDPGRLKIGQVGYGCWCDEDGKVLDDGTLTRWDEQHFRITSADPSYAWLLQNASGFDVRLVDRTDEIAGLALQGPTSRAILASVVDGAASGDVGSLRFFRAMRARVAGSPVEITRTGYTGDLGYELFMPAKKALAVYDALLEAGRPHGLLPLGLDALDVLRIEAGFVLMGVDYYSARTCLIEAQKSTPTELGLGWTVDLERAPFLGQRALRREQQTGAAWALVGLALDWDEFVALHDRWGLPPQLPAGASRLPVPVFAGRRQVGYATSSTWSPILKRFIALASVRAEHAAPGSVLRMEVTVQFERRSVQAVVTPTPFFDPPRKRARAGDDA
ncbi:MAG: aminomethyl transferase family protein [Planctomycetes bacterium]|nr:aminomethyl transferase family protein [Planctomycetota bacterium]